MTRRTAGLTILGVLSLLDVAGPLMTDGDHPPMSVALAGSVIGLLSLAALWYVARGARRAFVPLVVLRFLSAATAAPAFLVSDVPTGIRALVAGLVVLTVVGIALVLPTRSAEAVAS